MQKRAHTGVIFEKLSIPAGHIRKPKTPRTYWNGKKGQVLVKLKNTNYCVDDFNFDGGSFLKYDVVGINGELIEIKKYEKTQLNKWTMYSEPLFKVATRRNSEIIDVEKYNNFINDFYNKHIVSGFFSNLICEMTQIDGILTVDGIIPINHFEFRVVVVKGWKGFNRITTQFKLKDN
jgi:hypothetical protein